MPHIRTLIRRKVVEYLEAAGPISTAFPGIEIESGRLDSLEAAGLPRILVYFKSEEPDRELLTQSPREYAVNGDLIVEFISNSLVADGNFEEEADDAAELIEPVLDELESSFYDGLVRHAEYAGSEIIGQQQSARNIFGLRITSRLTWGRVVNRTAADAYLTSENQIAVGDYAEDHPEETIDLPQ